MDEALPQLEATLVCALGFLILYAGVNKFRYLDGFRTTLLYVPFMPTWLVPILVVAIPLLEILGGASLAVGLLVGTVITLALLGATSVVAIVAHKQKRRVPCICFSSTGSNSLSLSTAVRNAFFAAIAALPGFVRLPSPTTQLQIIISAVLLVLVFLAAETLIANLSMMKATERT